MVKSPTGETAESARHDRAPGKASDLLAIYERLLALYGEQLRVVEFNPYQPIPRLVWRSFNPAFQMRFWKHAAPFLSKSNTLAQDLVGGEVVLRELEALDDETLRGVAECSRINLRRLLRQSVLGWGPPLAAAAAALAALAKFLKDVIGVDLPETLSSGTTPFLTTVVVSAVIGFALGSIGNLVLSAPKLGFARAIDDLIAIAAAYRGAPRKE